MAFRKFFKFQVDFVWSFQRIQNYLFHNRCKMNAHKTDNHMSPTPQQAETLQLYGS